MIGEKFTYSNFKLNREIGNLIVSLPEPPPPEQAINYDLPKKEQSFQVIQDDITTKKKSQRIMSPAEWDAFEDREWTRRENGLWFYNNGYLEYITGLHYFYCGHWLFPVVREGRKKAGLPFWIDADRDYFYFWDYCYKDPKSYGMIYMTSRRNGKTFRGTCTNYEILSRSTDALSGIQSKNNTDGHKVFDKLINSWKKLPEFFKPIDSGETHPATSLKFREPGTRATKTIQKKYSKVLNSEITYGSAKEGHYDGDGLLFTYDDEFGKLEEGNIYKRWGIKKECLCDMGVITGKALFTSTVEDVNKTNIRETKQLWDESDVTKRTPLGETESGLYRLYKPAYYGYMGSDEDTVSYVDRYGYSNIEEAKKHLEKRRTNKKGASLCSEKRKYSFNEHEAFIIDNVESPLDTDRIYQQIEYNETLPPSTVVRGNFIWVVKDQEAKFVHDINGRWRVYWLPDGKRITPNKHSIVYGKFSPGNTEKLVSGVDPFDHKTVAGTKKSDGASVTRVRFDPMNPDDSKFFANFYLARPPKPEMFYEDMIIQCFFYGMKILSETNKIGLVNYFRMRGYENYLMHRPEPTQTAHSKKYQLEPGIPMSGDDARNALINALVTEVYDNVGYNEETDSYARNPFDEMLLDWAEFEVGDWTPYDLSVASGLCLLAEREYIVTPRPQMKDVQFVRKYRNVGANSVRM